MDLVRRQHFKCAISGRTLTPETASLDHIVPLAAGGGHAIENVWVVDHQVNTAKGTLSFEEFVAMCRDVVAHQDRPKEVKGVDEQHDGGAVPAAGPPEKMLFC